MPVYAFRIRVHGFSAKPAAVTHTRGIGPPPSSRYSCFSAGIESGLTGSPRQRVHACRRVSLFRRFGYYWLARWRPGEMWFSWSQYLCFRRKMIRRGKL